MKRILSRAILVGVIASSVSIAQNKCPKPRGHFTGKDWVQMSDQYKVGYLVGIVEYSNSDYFEGKLIFPDYLNVGEVEERLDTFYEDRRNLNVQIIKAISILRNCLKSKGCE